MPIAPPINFSVRSAPSPSPQVVYKMLQLGSSRKNQGKHLKLAFYKLCPVRSAPSPSPQVVYKMLQLGSSRIKIKDHSIL